MGSTILAVLAVLAPFAVAISVLTPHLSRVEVAKVKSPDGSLIATVAETNVDATTSFGYEIKISRNWPVRWGQTVARFYAATRNECAYGVNIRWVDANSLRITYMTARLAKVLRSASILGRDVQVTAAAGINDSSAPCGGMEFNQLNKARLTSG